MKVAAANTRAYRKVDLAAQDPDATLDRAVRGNQEASKLQFQANERIRLNIEQTRHNRAQTPTQSDIIVPR